MTAASAPSGPLRAGRRPRPAAWRLLRLELRRATMLRILPLLGVLLAATELRNDLGHAPLWPVRSTVVQYQMELIGAVVAGVAAWTAGRDRRRDLTDLVTATARPRWARQLASLAAVTAWAILLYAASVAAVFVVTSRQATWGGPIWWLPGVGAAAIVAFSAVGFAFGAFFPGRFTAPLVVAGAVLAPQVGVLALQRHQSWGLVSPAEDATVPGTGIFFPFHAGLSIVQITFLAGLTAVALGILAVPAAAGGLWLRRAGAMIALAGLAAACTGVALAGTARQQAQGIIVPALHTAASDTLITYSPACDNSSAVPVCLHPAYRATLPALEAALDPVLSQVSGLPGAPVRVKLGQASAQQVSGQVVGGNAVTVGGHGVTIGGSPPVLYLSPTLLLGLETCPKTDCFTIADFTHGLGQDAAVTIIHTVIYGRPTPARPVPSPAQQAIAAALIRLSGARVPAGPGVRQAGSGVSAAARRFAALPAGARRAWLAAHLGALRAGRITLAEIP